MEHSARACCGDQIVDSSLLEMDASEVAYADRRRTVGSASA
jgi:hypothetical protein